MKAKKEKSYCTVDEVFEKLFPQQRIHHTGKDIEKPSIAGSLITAELLSKFRHSLARHLKKKTYKK